MDWRWQVISVTEKFMPKISYPVFLGAVVKDPVQDKVVWQEYMETVVKNRDGWKDIYRASRDMI